MEDVREPFARELDRAIRDSGLTLAAIRAELAGRGVSISNATLSSWRSGSRRPEPARSSASVESMEEVLGVPPGTLLRHLGTRSRRIGPVATHLVDEQDAGAAETLKALDPAPAERFRFLSITETVRVDTRGSVSLVESVIVVQCVLGSLDTIGFVVTASDATDVTPELIMESGGECDRTIRHRDRRHFGFRIRLDRALRVGETAILSYTVRLPVGYPSQRWFETSVRHSVRELIHRVIFPDEYALEWADETLTTPKGAFRPRTLIVEGRNALHSIRTGFGPGAVRIRWGDEFE